MAPGLRSSVTAGTATWSTVASRATRSRLTQRTTRTTQRLAPAPAARRRRAAAAVVVPDMYYLPDVPSRSAGLTGWGLPVTAAGEERCLRPAQRRRVSRQRTRVHANAT